MTPQRAFFGRPPLAPLALAASAFAADLTFPPLYPSATAAGFLRGTALALDVLNHVFLRQLRHALHRKFRDFQRQGLIGGDVARVKGGITTGHQFAAFHIHRRIKPYRLGYVKWAQC